MEKKYDYETLKKELNNNIVELSFEKKNGEMRDMTCTLLSEYIPEDMKPKGVSKKKPNKNVLSVYDIKAQSWRSFRLDSIKKLEIIK